MLVAKYLGFLAVWVFGCVAAGARCPNQLHIIWGCVAEFGVTVEMGKRDLLGDGKLDIRTFLANRSYSCVDIDQLRKRTVFLRR